MPSFRTSRMVPHSAKAMFDLVADVEAYPNFLPLCRALTVREHTTLPDGRTLFVADMEVGYKAIRERFTSRVTCDAEKLEILVEYIDGPFRHLENRWRFVAHGERSCKVEFDISYEFKSRALAVLVGGMFETAFRKFAEAFENRADLVYGRAG
ncbi:ubiquinone-binding protein [Methylovirgula ligni]|uniref:Coenzyme Q-binding protein COQ10 n=1 Tax=Methylovirgula ligni TaxID=569860 RepID=A0A3D9YKU9_9HYPH|nr:type II toxin-antitoxin system RatA family toxin [Methylovirgula ligni]QAY96767.1 ubiquinone-binding protein [Methylovirgula ligni]REF83185.1 coenzyme Q-binding protein COQ10 [Methylovirgula ligni]